MKINIIAVGSLNDKYKPIYQEYIKKINFFASINLIEIKEIVEENIELKIKKETKLILEKIPKNSHVIYLSLYGKKMDSIEFSKMLDVDNLTFIIGGSNGVDETYSFLSSWILLLINLYLLTTSSYSALEIILFS